MDEVVGCGREDKESSHAIGVSMAGFHSPPTILIQANASPTGRPRFAVGSPLGVAGQVEVAVVVRGAQAADARGAKKKSKALTDIMSLFCPSVVQTAGASTDFQGDMPV